MLTILIAFLELKIPSLEEMSFDSAIFILFFHFSLLLRRECCSFSNGEYVKSGLAELEQWCCFATEEVSFDLIVFCYEPP